MEKRRERQKQEYYAQLKQFEAKTVAMKVQIKKR
jgi:hypothetical protein